MGNREGRTDTRQRATATHSELEAAREQIAALRRRLDEYERALQTADERRSTVDALRLKSEGRFRAIIEASPVPMALNDEEQRITFLNDAFVRTFGYSLGDIPTLAEWWPRAYPDLDYRRWIAGAWQTELERAKRTGTVFTPIEVRVVCKDGSARIVLVSAAPLAHAFEGDHLVVLYDITERTRAAEEKAELARQLQQAQKMESVGRLAGGVAHDFNNMLGVILGHAEVAKARALAGQPIADNIQEIVHAARRSADLTGQLLAFARKQPIAPRVLDLNQTTEATLAILRRLIGENIELRWQPAPTLWPVKADPVQLEQLLANLCVNARDAIADVGTITIETSHVTLDESEWPRHPGARRGDYVRLSVTDDGCGMSQQTLSHIFEPFYTTKSVGHGTGLGLATVYGIVQQNDGFITVSSTPGLGASFRVHLPRHRGQPLTPEPESADRPVARGHETILLVEDEPAMLTLCRQLLEGLGYTVLAARTPGEALRTAREHTGAIHLLLTDVIMPEMNGRDLATTIAAVRPSIKLLAMSGYTANVVAPHGVLEDGVNFLAKPFTVEEIAAKMREVLDA